MSYPDWLKQHEYRTVLRVNPETSNTADNTEPPQWINTAAVAIVGYLRPYIDTWERDELAATIEATQP